MEERLQILLIDDNPDDRLLVIRELNREFSDLKVEQVTNADNFQNVLQNFFDLVITDYQLRWTTGLDILKKIKADHPDVPVIMFTGTGSEEIAVDAMKAGLDDYVLKSPRHFKRLSMTVKRLLQRTRDARHAKEIEKRYQHLFNNLPLCVYRSTIEGTFLDINPAGLRLFGFESLEDIGQIKIPDLYENVKYREQLLKYLMAHEQLSGWRERLCRKDGSGFWAEIHSTMIKDKKGVPVYIDGIIEDVNRLVEAEEELKKVISTLHAVVDHIPEGVFLIDKDNRIVLTNPIANDYLKTIAGVGLGKTISEIMGRKAEAFLISSPNMFWHIIEVSDPSHRVFEVAGRSIQVAGLPGGSVFVIRDVTKERMLQNQVQSQERLAAVGQLAAGIAHDFNNILTVIIGYAEILLDDETVPEKVKQSVEAIMKDGQRAAGLIRQILDFSRKSASEMEVLNLTPFLREFSDFIRRTISENINVSLDYKPGEYIVIADPTKIQQVLTNLVINARDVMPDGGKLTLGFSLTTLNSGDNLPFTNMPTGEWVNITVTDTGTGIPSEVLPHLFEPFFSTKKVGQGTGLGLSQVYGIVKQHKGYIDVVTETGKGTTFIIYLPSVKMQVDDRAAPVESIMQKGHGETILVVEDDVTVRDIVQTMLATLGYTILTATNGREALRVFNEHKEVIELVITDIIMPEMGGMELARQLKEMRNDIKIIALSGYPMAEKQELLLNEGIIALHLKPIDMRNLSEVVNNVLMENTKAKKDRCIR